MTAPRASIPNSSHAPAGEPRPGPTEALAAEARALAHRIGSLRAEARALARTVALGLHGRRRKGAGEEFWQYRPAMAGDDATAIDWRRSARDDTLYLREREWQAAQHIHLAVERGAAMHFTSRRQLPTKAERARVLALALGELLLEGGEKVGLLAPPLPPSSGRAAGERLAHGLLDDLHAPPARDHLPLPLDGMRNKAWGGHLVLIADFLMPRAMFDMLLARLAATPLRLTLLQILDPAEERFPFSGRTEFVSVSGAMRHELREPGALAARYRALLDARQAALREAARRRGWRFSVHHTDRPATEALAWLAHALEPVR